MKIMDKTVLKKKRQVPSASSLPPPHYQELHSGVQLLVVPTLHYQEFYPW